MRCDGEDPGESGAVKYFDKLVDGAGASEEGKKRDPKVVANWYVPTFHARRNYFVDRTSFQG